MTKIGRLEDMDVQLRSQLEKLIAQRNQLNGDKAARDIEVGRLKCFAFVSSHVHMLHGMFWMFCMQH